MTQTSKPEKSKVHSWMQKRQAERVPPPTPDQIRRELRWQMVEAERETNRPKK